MPTQREPGRVSVDGDKAVRLGDRRGRCLTATLPESDQQEFDSWWNVYGNGNGRAREVARDIWATVAKQKNVQREQAIADAARDERRKQQDEMADAHRRAENARRDLEVLEGRLRDPWRSPKTEEETRALNRCLSNIISGLTKASVQRDNMQDCLEFRMSVDSRLLAAARVCGPSPERMANDVAGFGAQVAEAAAKSFTETIIAELAKMSQALIKPPRIPGNTVVPPQARIKPPKIPGNTIVPLAASDIVRREEGWKRWYMPYGA